MQKILNQEEIDALFKRARGGKPTGEGAGARVITPCDFRSAGQITKEQLRLLTALHETFARNLSHALGAYLRIGLEMAVVSVEQLTYAEFLQRLPDATYFGTMKVNELEKTAGITIALPIAFRILDLLLGARGRAEGPVGKLTVIEAEIFASVVAMIVGGSSSSARPLLPSHAFRGRRV